MSETRDPVRRCAIIVPYGELPVLPSVVNTAEVLGEQGYTVDVVAIASNRFASVPEHRFNAEGIRVSYYRPSRLARLPAIGWWFRVRGLSNLVSRVVRSDTYQFFLGVDAEGLIAATFAAKPRGVPVVYHSLEMELAKGELRQFLGALSNRTSPAGVLMRRFAKNRLTAWTKKPVERWAHRRSRLTLALDAERAKLLLEDNRHPEAPVVILPTSPLGLRRVPDRSYLRRKYRLGAQRKILLQIGGISDVARSLELARSTARWPEEWILILHGFAAEEAYLREIRKVADGARVILSTDLVPYEALDDLVASADIGLALYRPIDLNYYHMASGKILQYLKCGLPVIASDFPNIRAILEGNRCGICIANEEHLAPAAREILREPDSWAANAERCFLESYDFRKRFEEVKARIERW